jgi:hypothetical protein
VYTYAAMMRAPRGLVSGLAFLALAAAAPAAAPATAPSGREIMERVDARDDGDLLVQELAMRLIDANGASRARRLRMWRRDVGADVQTILFFLSPADVKDTGLLTYDYDDAERDDDQWLYLPALKKTKRIAAADKSGSFMGSDFSYADLTQRDVDRYDYRLLEEAQRDGVPIWRVEAVPNDPAEISETGYTKIVWDVRQDNAVVVGGVFTLRRGGRVKTYTVKRLEQIDGIWVPTQMHMITRKGDVTLHETLLDFERVRFGQPLADDRFSVRQLEKGP